MSDTCLMVELNSNKYFAAQSDLMALTTFANTFQAKVSLVRGEQLDILSLDDLAKAVCQGVKKNKGTYEVLDVLIQKDSIYTAARPEKGSKSRKDEINLAGTIRRSIRQAFLDRRTVSLKLLAEQFKDYNLSTPCLCNHLQGVRRAMESEGFKIDKISHGHYRLAE